MARSLTVIGWTLPREKRSALLKRFGPKYDKVVADHVTLRVSSALRPALPQKPKDARIVGRSDDLSGLACLVVELDGTTRRTDGSFYHITWSLEPNRKARESNDLFRDRGWKPLSSPLELVLEPARF